MVSKAQKKLNFKGISLEEKYYKRHPENDYPQGSKSGNKFLAVNLTYKGKARFS